MVFHCRCFSFLLQEVLLEEDQEIKYETITQTNTTSTFYTAALNFDWLAPENASELRAQTETSFLTDGSRGTQDDSTSSTFYTAASDFIQSVPNSHGEILILAENVSKLRVFTITELQAAVNRVADFRDPKIGKDGTVCKGLIKSLQSPFYWIDVVVKHAKVLCMRQEWETKIDVLGTVEHPNLVKVIGYCLEEIRNDTELYIVYEYMINRSVADHLYAHSETPLSWNMRLKIAQDAARGLTYLHEEMEFQVILRDFKSSNILLDDQWNVKLADFGLALLQTQEQNASTTFVGTKAYAAPECITLQGCTSKSDVWSYGVFMYELITGRRPLDKNQYQNEQKLLKWVKPYVGSITIRKIVDPRLEGKYPLKSAQKLLGIANRCLFEDPESRPKMSEVLKMINQLAEFASQPNGPDIKTSNDDKKNSIGNQRRLPSCLSCLNKKRNT